jgi:hypothetical protein
MPTSTTWRKLPNSNVEVLEMVATNSSSSITYARDQLIQLAATLMHTGTQGGYNVEIPLDLEVSQESDRSIKMVVTYVAQNSKGLVARMATRRRMLIEAAAA